MFIETGGKRNVRWIVNPKKYIQTLRKMLAPCIQKDTRDSSEFSDVRIHWTDTRHNNTNHLASNHEQWVYAKYKNNTTIYQTKADMMEAGFDFQNIANTLELKYYTYKKDEKKFQEVWLKTWGLIIKQHPMFMDKMTWGEENKDEGDTKEEKTIYNKHGYNRHVFDVIQTYYGNKFYQNTDSVISAYNDWIAVVGNDETTFMLHNRLDKISKMADDRKFNSQEKHFIKRKVLF
jgi:hypothetical protein